MRKWPSVLDPTSQSAFGLPRSVPGMVKQDCRLGASVPRCRGVRLLVSASPSGAVFFCEFLFGDIEFRHRRFEILVFEFLRWNTGVLFDLPGVAL
jgi:hypothetical protein